MQFIDLKAQQQKIRSLIEEKIKVVLDHGKYIMGPEVDLLESRLASYVGVNHAISCASGTDALLLALMAQEVQPGDCILTTPFTFMATAETIALLGAIPVFVDIDPITFNLDVDQVGKAIAALQFADSAPYPLPRGVVPGKQRLGGIIAVDLFGIPADYRQINAIAAAHGLFVIEDAAQSCGGERAGKRACGLAQIGCTSFFPAKPLGGYGDGGMCFTDDAVLAERMRSLRVHGQGQDKYENVRIGLNGRLDTLQAAILLAKLEIFPEEVQRRQEVAGSYAELLDGPSSPVVVPRVPSDCLSAWAQYSVLAKDGEHRAQVQDRLRQAHVPTAIYYPKPLHLQEAFAFLGYKEGDFPVSEDCARRIFSLPMHPYLTRAEQEQIATLIAG